MLDGIGELGADEQLVCDYVLGIGLLASIHHILRVDEAALARPTAHRVVAGWRVRELARRELKVRFAQADATQEQLALARRAPLLLVTRAAGAGAAGEAVYVLIALGRVLGKVDAGAEHAADVGVSLVEAAVDDARHKG